MRAASFFLLGCLLQSSILRPELSLAYGNHAASKNAVWNATLTTGSSRHAPFLILQNGTFKIVDVKQAPKRKIAGITLTAQKPIPPATKQQNILPVFQQKDIKEKHQRIASDALRLLPAKCQDTLKSFYVRYDNPKNRGLAGKSTMILDGNVSDDEYRALFLHEFGHVTDLGCLQGTATSGISEFKDGNDPVYNDDPSLLFYRLSWINEKTQKAGMKGEDFISGYSSWDAFEDLAESYAYFVLQREAFEERAKTNPVIAAKLQWLKTYIFTEGAQLAAGKHQWAGTPPWDVTKLPYTWQATTAIAQK